MVETCADPDAELARTFRSRERLDTITPPFDVELEAVAIHRWFYLSLTTAHDLSNGRGRVTPLASGRWRLLPSRDSGADEWIEAQFTPQLPSRELRLTHECRLRSVLSPAD